VDLSFSNVNIAQTTESIFPEVRYLVSDSYKTVGKGK
jgi:hypothetical protein